VDSCDMPVATSTLCMASQVQGSTLIEFEAHVTNAPDMPARTRTIGFINCAHFADHFMLLVYATAVITMAPEFGLSYGAGIALSTGLFACFGLFSLPAGWLADRWSRRHMLAVFWFGGGSCMILTGLAATPWQLVAAMTVMGMFAAIYHPVGTAMLISMAGASGRALGLNGVFGNLGVASAPLVTGLILDLWGWRWAFVLPGLVMIAFGLAYLTAIPKGAAAPGRGAASAARPAGALDLRLIVIILGLTVLAGGFTFNTVTVALPKFVVEELPGFTTALAWAGTIATTIYLAGAVTQLIVGRLADRFPLGATFFTLAMLQVAGFTGMALLSGPAALAAAAMSLSAVYGQVLINDLIIARNVADLWRARAFAMRYMLGFAASAGAVPLIAILHRPETGYGPVFVVMAGFALVIAASAGLYAMVTARAPAVTPAE
jgi:MFS family permease